MKPVLFLIIISALFYGIWRWNSPYPNPLNWDIWEHQTVINVIRGGSFAWLPSQLSDTFRFDGYTTAFHVLIAGMQNLVNVHNVLGFWWIAEGIFFVLTTLAAYAFVLAITKNTLAAVAGGILSAGLFESAVAFTTLFLLPQTVAALIWVVGMTIVVTQKTKRKKLLAALVTTLVILPFHAIVGALGALFLFITAINPKLNVLLVLAVSFAVPTLIAPHLAGLNTGEAQYYNQTILEKLTLMRQWYGFLPIPLLILGMWKGNRTLTTLLAISIGLIASPFPYVLKFMVIIHYVIVASMAMGIVEIVNLPSISVLTAAVLLIFISNTMIWKNPVIFRGVASHVSGDETKAAEFLRQNYKRSFLVSDPATQNILEPLTGIDTQGGAYMTAESRKHLLQMDIPSGTLLVISARTVKWIHADPKDQMSVAFNLWRPDALSLDDQLYIQRLGLHEIYRNPSIVIFAI